MNVAFIYDLQDNKNILLIENIKEINEDAEGTERINIIEKYNQRNRIDVFVIISNEIQQITDYIKNIKNKIHKILIITENLDTEHILKCIEITPNISYMNNKIENILNKIYLLGKKVDE